MLILSPSLQPGEPAPDFTLPAIHREGHVSLADYKGRSALLLALFRGLYCPFCRRGISQLALTADKLAAAGVQTLAVVATPLERARLYFRYRPAARLALAADPELVTLRAFRVPRP
jgi:peroxiredoxin